MLFVRKGRFLQTYLLAFTSPPPPVVNPPFPQPSFNVHHPLSIIHHRSFLTPLKPLHLSPTRTNPPPSPHQPPRTTKEFIRQKKAKNSSSRASTQGPYAPGTFRFRITFPSQYPYAPPVVTFNTDIFHPLITPVTGYSYNGLAAGPGRGGDVSGRDREDVERLPAGGLSLRQGFPVWHSGSSSKVPSKVPPSKQQSPGESSSEPSNGRPAGHERSGADVIDADDPDGNETNHPPPPTEQMEDTTIADLLLYIRNIFEKPEILDSIPLEGAVNGGAWFAWQSYRGRNTTTTTGDTTATTSGATTSGSNAQSPNSGPADMTPPRAKGPQDWNWEGVWEERVKRAVDNSVSEGALFGGQGAKEDDIRFASLGEGELGEVRGLIAEMGEGFV